QAAPTELLSVGPPTMAVLPSADSATEKPCWEEKIAPVPTSFACSIQIPPVRVKIHAAPVIPSSGPPTMAVLPSEDSATEKPGWVSHIPPLPTNLPCWVQTPPLRVKTHAAPGPSKRGRKVPSSGPPTMAVLPSEDSATEDPCRGAKVSVAT